MINQQEISLYIIWCLYTNINHYHHQTVVDLWYALILVSFAEWSEMALAKHQKMIDLSTERIPISISFVTYSFSTFEPISSCAADSLVCWFILTLNCLYKCARERKKKKHWSPLKAVSTVHYFYHVSQLFGYIECHHQLFAHIFLFIAHFC